MKRWLKSALINLI